MYQYSERKKKNGLWFKQYKDYRMDILKSVYASDSSEEEDASDILQEPHSVSESEEHPDIEPNVFGLVPKETTKAQVSEVNSAEVSKTVNIGGTDTVVCIPNSEFWTSVVDTDLETLQRENKTQIYREKVAIQSHKATSSKRSIDDWKANAPNAKAAKQSTVQPSVTSSDFVALNNSSRKIFYVHSKITPYLHTKHCLNRPPRRQEWTVTGHAGAVNRVKWNIPSYSHLLVSCAMDSSIKVWNIWSKLDPCVKVLSLHNKAVRDVCWSNSGNQLLSCSYDKTAAITEIESGKCISRFEHSSYVTCCLYHFTQPNLCVTGENNKIQVWDMRSPKLPCRTLQYKDTIGQMQDLVLSADGSTLFSCSDLVSRDSADRNLMAWYMDTGTVLSNQIFQERYTITRLRNHPHDNSLLAQCQGNYIAIFSRDRPYKMNKHKRFEGHKLLGYNIGFDISSDGQIIYSGSSDGRLYCYDYQSGKRLDTKPTDLDVILDVDCHPILPSTVALSAWNGSLSIWS